jgi:glutamate---cysteine ligase / carboxylate-amine ligase
VTFGSGQPFTVGIEEELFLVDPDTHALVHDAGRVLSGIDAPLKVADHEAYACEIELRTPPCATADEGAQSLRRSRDAARAAGATLAGVGLHPDAAFGDVRLVDKPRYRGVEESMRGLMQRTPECALHVHVGMPDADTAIRVYNRLRENLPLLTGLTANSPWWHGRDSGLASARAAAVRAYPGRGIPPAFPDHAAYEEALAATAAGGGPDDYTLLWWDVRPHPRLGTVEVREMDAQSRVADAAGVAALVQVLARLAAEEPARAPASADAISWSGFRAARDGLEASILHDGELVPVREAAQRALAAAGPVARELGADGALAGVEAILREGNGADRRRADHRRGGMSGLLAGIVADTASR